MGLYNLYLFISMYTITYHIIYTYICVCVICVIYICVYPAKPKNPYCQFCVSSVHPESKGRSKSNPEPLS